MGYLDPCGVKTLEERNRKLTELLERAYGVIAGDLNLHKNRCDPPTTESRVR